MTILSNNLQDILEFKINNADEARLFDEYLSNYSKKTAMMDYPYLPLYPAYKYYIEQNNNPRAFYALFDIKICYIHLMGDMRMWGGIWNEAFSKGKHEGGSILDHPEKFEGKMAIHRFQTSFIFRYRAIWDKIMGFIILTQNPSHYDDFMKSKSKKRTFRKQCGSSNILPEELITSIEEGITYFDDTFRTPEAHSTGKMRLWTFTMDSMADNPQIELMAFSNYLIGTLIMIQSLYGIIHESKDNH